MTTCPGSGVLVHEQSTDGDGLIGCPVCPRPWLLTEEVAGSTRRIEDHTRGPLGRSRLAEMARDQATDEAVAAHIEARYETGVGQ